MGRQVTKNLHNITLLCTAHEEIGKCNSEELLKIIESISPEVIFEELSDDLFDGFYKANQYPNESPEVKCVKRYLQTKPIEHIPVDIEVSPNLSTSDIDFMFNTFKKYDIYKQLENEQSLLTAQDGFAFLNSNKCSELFERKKTAEKDLMQFEVAKNILFQIHKAFYEEHDNRERMMLQKIYDYSKKNQYDRAVLLIGSGHRNSMMQKITEIEAKEKSLSWAFYSAS